MANILITGASGLIGKPLSELFLNNGHTVVHLGRKENLNTKFKCYKWDINNVTVDERAFENIDTIIHLAGAGIADKRWTDSRKKEIIDSRVRSSEILAKEIEKRKGQIKTFIGTSAIGYYGAITNETVYTEDMHPGNDFMAQVCKLWEESYKEIDANVTRKVIVRIGVVLSAEGGALPKLAKPVRMGFGTALGSGKQYVPWIHINDLVNIFYEAATIQSYNGIYNAVSSQHLNNLELTKAIGKSIHKSLWMPAVPKFALKLMLGEMAAMVIEGSKVSNKKLLDQGFNIKYDNIDTALTDLLNKKAH